jgi:hypothetical protein
MDWHWVLVRRSEQVPTAEEMKILVNSMPAVLVDFDLYRYCCYWVQQRVVVQVAALKVLVHYYCVRRSLRTVLRTPAAAAAVYFDSHHRCCYWVQQEPPAAVSLKVLAHYYCARSLTTVLAHPVVANLKMVSRCQL